MSRDLIGAFGGGGKQKSPTRTADTLLSDDYVEVILGLGQGPWRGLVPGVKPDRPLQNFFIGNTPLQNAATGLSNFSDFSADFYNGTETDGTIQNKLGGITSNLTVGVRLAQSVDVVRQTPPSMRGQINQLEFRILFNQLVLQTDTGTFETTARFAIAYKLSTSPTWKFYRDETVSSVYGKTSNGYVKDFLITVPLQSAADYDVRVTKMSPDNGTQDVIEMTWESLQMTTLGARSYPDLAVAHLYGKASNQFQDMPEFSGVFEGMCEMKLPTNYNPDTRTYDESTPWNGSFKLGYSNNNAWVLYDLLTNPIYGLAKYYKNVAANRYEFYEGAKWCDELVSNGQGGLQPRFTYNDLYTDLRPGLEALAYIAGSFNSVIFDDGNGTIRLRLDKYETPKQIFTPENISSAGFNYTFTDITTRVNDVTVSFVNPDLDWTDDRRATTIDTSEWKAKNGVTPEEFLAVGCTDVHEALRRANYRVLTANTEVTNVVFTTSRFGVFTEVFDSIYIADPDAGWSTGGRIKSIKDGVIYLRDPLYFSDLASTVLKVQTYEGIVEVTVAPPATGVVYSLPIISGTLPAELPDRTAFTAENSGTMGIAKPFKVVSIENSDGSPDQYQITATEINVNKYRDAEANTISTPTTYSFRKPGIPLSAANLTVESGTKQLLVSSDGTLIPRIYISWARPLRSYIDHFEIDFQEVGTGVWRTEKVYTDFYYIHEVITGRAYDIHLTSVSALGVRSAPIMLNDYIVIGKEELPPIVTGLLLTPVGITWDEIDRREVPDLRGYLLRFQYGDNTDWGTATKLHEGFLTESPFKPAFHLSGTITILAKAVDTSSHESEFAATMVGNLGGLAILNIAQSINLDPTFTGTYDHCSVEGGELVASALDSFYGPDNESFFGRDSESFFEDTLGYSQMVYTTDELAITGATSGSTVILDMIADGSSVVVEYREFISVPFFGGDTDSFFGPDDETFYGLLPEEWKMWRGGVPLPNGSYQFRVTINSSSVRGRISLMRLLVSAPDRYEDIGNLTIASGGTVIPYTMLGVTAIKTIMVSINANGVGVVRTAVDKTNPLAPVIFAYNSSNVATGGATVDVTITGY